MSRLPAEAAVFRWAHGLDPPLSPPTSTKTNLEHAARCAQPPRRCGHPLRQAMSPVPRAKRWANALPPGLGLEGYPIVPCWFSLHSDSSTNQEEVNQSSRPHAISIAIWLVMT